MKGSNGGIGHLQGPVPVQSELSDGKKKEEEKKRREKKKKKKRDVLTGGGEGIKRGLAFFLIYVSLLRPSLPNPDSS